jgi:hypothetical protein
MLSQKYNAETRKLSRIGLHRLKERGRNYENTSENDTTQKCKSVDTGNKDKQLLRFYIGLQLLGKEREQRFLEYMLSLQKKSNESRETP